MPSIEKSAASVAASASAADVQLYVLDHGGNRILAVRGDGSRKHVLVDEGCNAPDGIAIDLAQGHLYWTNMGDPSRDDGFIMRCDLDGTGLTTIVPPGITHTPKQLVLDSVTDSLYWCDREGMRIMRCGLNGSSPESILRTGDGASDREDARNWCVGIAIDPKTRDLFWTQKGATRSNTGRIFRMALGSRQSLQASSEVAIELLFSSLPEPVDLEFDASRQILYWTDRGAAPYGNTVNRVFLDDGEPSRLQRDILVDGMQEAIGLSLHPGSNVLFATDLGGNVYRISVDSKRVDVVLKNAGRLTGIVAV